MFSRPDRSPLTFQDAMSIHLYKALRYSTVEMIRRFGNYPRIFNEILTGRSHGGSWAEAVEKFTHGNYWHPEIAGMIADSGYMRILSALTASSPNTPRCAARLFYSGKFYETAALQ